jgi:hypothetical protein
MLTAAKPGSSFFPLFPEGFPDPVWINSTGKSFLLKKWTLLSNETAPLTA